VNILIVEPNKITRDQILVGLQNFPEFAVDTGEGFGGLNRTKSKDYDCVFIGSNLQGSDQGIELIESLRGSDTETDIVLVTDAKKAKAHQSMRTRWNLFSILYLPIEPREFFRLVARLRRRENEEART
jgi:DNA-binding response OmpR family regulator